MLWYLVKHSDLTFALPVAINNHYFGGDIKLINHSISTENINQNSVLHKGNALIGS
jgi:hypothetical protein